MTLTGLRAFLRFLTGLYVCLNRGDVDLKSQQVIIYSALSNVLLNMIRGISHISLILVFTGSVQQKQRGVL